MKPGDLSTTLIENVLAALSRNRQTASLHPAPPASGVYALFAKPGCRLTDIELAPSGLIYIGLSKDLAARDHFRARHSGFNSPRRTLGAILKEELGLLAIPRAAGASITNSHSYRFTEEGEQKLTRWMIENLECAMYVFDGDVRSLEKRLIQAGSPALNLTGWLNPQKQKIQALRNRCKTEAEKAALLK